MLAPSRIDGEWKGGERNWADSEGGGCAPFCSGPIFLFIVVIGQRQKSASPPRLSLLCEEVKDGPEIFTLHKSTTADGRWVLARRWWGKNKENLNIHLSQQLLTFCMKLLFNGFISSPASLLLGNNKLSISTMSESIRLRMHVIR